MTEENIQQHSTIVSILLHLVPGIPILLGIFLFSIPVFSEILGIDIKLKAMVGICLSILFMLIPLQLGILFYEGKKRNGRFSLKGIIRYTERSSLKDYLIFVPILSILSRILEAGNKIC